MPRPAKTTRTRKPGAPRVSPTKLNTYQGCPRQYFFQYIGKYPRRPRSYYSFGTSLHGALQDFHQQGGTATQPVEELIVQLQTSWVEAGYGSAEESAARMQQGQEMLAAYYVAETERKVETLFLEKTLSWQEEGFILSGRVDRIDRRPDGVVEVVDYKSGSYLPTPEELEEDLAIGIYQILVCRNLETAPVIGTIYNLRSNESTSVIRDEAEIASLEGEVCLMAGTILGDTEFLPKPGSLCRYCDFIPYCPDADV